MIMSWIFTGMLAISVVCSGIQGNGQALSAAVLQGAQAGMELAVSMAGSLCLWAGVGRVLDGAGITDLLSRLLRPVLHRLFPTTKTDAELAQCISGNVCANILGLGNAATPMGIRAAGRLRDPDDPARATDELCRLVVMNTASIQLLPTTVATLRRTAGCTTPFDILPCVWVSSILSVSAGLLAAWALGRVWRG